MNEKLKQLYIEDQEDRKNPINKQLRERDAVRRAQALEIIEDHQPETVEDCYFAAMLFQHGENPEDYQRANELCQKGIEIGDDQNRKDEIYGGVRWLYAASMDRWMISLGKPQKYGTQLSKNEDGSLEVTLPIDPNVTDEERQSYFCPPLNKAVGVFLSEV